MFDDYYVDKLWVDHIGGKFKISNNNIECNGGIKCTCNKNEFGEKITKEQMDEYIQKTNNSFNTNDNSTEFNICDNCGTENKFQYCECDKYNFYVQNNMIFNLI